MGSLVVEEPAERDKAGSKNNPRKKTKTSEGIASRNEHGTPRQKVENYEARRRLGAVFRAHVNMALDGWDSDYRRLPQGRVGELFW